MTTRNRCAESYTVHRKRVDHDDKVGTYTPFIGRSDKGADAAETREPCYFVNGTAGDSRS